MSRLLDTEITYDLMPVTATDVQRGLATAEQLDNEETIVKPKLMIQGSHARSLATGAKSLARLQASAGCRQEAAYNAQFYARVYAVNLAKVKANRDRPEFTVPNLNLANGKGETINLLDHFNTASVSKGKAQSRTPLNTGKGEIKEIDLNQFLDETAQTG